MNYLSRSINRIVFVVLLSLPLMAQAALPDFTTIVDSAKDSAVNISTEMKARPSSSKEYNLPELPEGSPFGELFEKFFDRDEMERGRRDTSSPTITSLPALMKSS